MVELFPEARTFGVGIVLAHQYLDQRAEELCSAILGHVGTVIAFRLGARDAAFLIDAFAPEFQEEDLIHLPAHAACFRRLVNGMTSRPFRFRPFPLPQVTRSYRERIMAESRRRDGRPVAAVEWEMTKDWQALSSSDQSRLHW